MSKRRFLRTLEAFQAELSDRFDLDEDVMERLREIQEDIEDIIAHGSMVPSRRRRDLVNAMKTLVDDFEISHPELTAFIGQTAESLARMGI